MALSNTLKKMIVFSSEGKRRLLEGLVKDQAADTGASESSIIEHALQKSLLPANENAVYWVDRLYNGGTLAEAYTSVFAFLAAGLDWDAAAPNGKPIVAEFARVLAYGYPKLSGEEHELHHLRSQLDTIAELLPSPEHYTPSGGDKAFARILLQQLCDNPSEFALLDLVGLIVRNWPVLGNSTWTYRALTDLASLSAPCLRNTPSTRQHFLKALTAVSAEWPSR